MKAHNSTEVAQISNKSYPRFRIGWPSGSLTLRASPHGRQITNLRYGRVPTCAALFFVCALAAGLSGCVTKGEAEARVRAAYLAGQQQARMEMGHQNLGPTVTIKGPVSNPTVAWTPEMTLAKAILAAGYYGAIDPAEIVIVRSGQTVPVDPKQLLNGQDVPLESGDVVQIK